MAISIKKRIMMPRLIALTFAALLVKILNSTTLYGILYDHARITPHRDDLGQ
jgi:hypothetical protein